MTQPHITYVILLQLLLEVEPGDVDNRLYILGLTDALRPVIEERLSRDRNYFIVNEDEDAFPAISILAPHGEKPLLRTKFNITAEFSADDLIVYEVPGQPNSLLFSTHDGMHAFDTYILDAGEFLEEWRLSSESVRQILVAAHLTKEQKMNALWAIRNAESAARLDQIMKETLRAHG